MLIPLFYLLYAVYGINTPSPVDWVASPHFVAGRATIVPNASWSTYQELTITFSQSLSNIPTQGIAVGYSDFNFAVSGDLVIWMIPKSKNAASFYLTIETLSVSHIGSLKISYIALDPTITTPVSITYFTDPIPASGPFSNKSAIINFTSSTGITLDLNNDNAMIAFINSVDASSSSLCYEINLDFFLMNKNQYQIKVSTTCNMILYGYTASRIIFDITAIQSKGYSYFQYGELKSSNGNFSPLFIDTQPYIDQNFMFGMKSFKIRSITKFLFSTSFGNRTQVSSPMNYDVLNFMYWSLKYRECASNLPYFRPFNELCYDLCPDGTYTKFDTKQCLECNYTCATCSSFNICTSCDPNTNRREDGTLCPPKDGYFDNGTAEAAPCSQAIQNCNLCQSQSVCINCQNGTFLTISKDCQLCSDSISNCSQCVLIGGVNKCTICQTYFIMGLNNITCQPPPCTDIGCIWCPINQDTCDVCSEGYNLSSSKCEAICGDGLILGNEECDDSNTQDGDGCNSDCTIGNNNGCLASIPFISPITSNCTDDCTLGYFRNFDHYQCSSCFYTCQSCSNNINCDSCLSSNHRQLILGKCEPTFGYYDNDTAKSVPCQQPCESCISDSQCKTCILGFFISFENCIPCSSITANCSECLQTMAVCTNCDLGYLYNSTTLLCDEVPCHDNNCISCPNNDAICQICRQGFIILNKKCQQVCGDNIKIGKQYCDDGNTKNNDGCSTSCKIQTNFQCQQQQNPTFQNLSKSTCYFIGQLKINPIYIDKLFGKNSISIKLNLQPKQLQIWKHINFTQMITLNSQIPISSYSIKYNNDGTVDIQVNYSQNIQNKDILVIFNPSATNQSSLSRLPVFEKSIHVIPSDNQAAYFYSPNFYSLQSLIDKLGMAISLAALLVLFATAIIGGKMIGIQMMAVIQISFFSLMTMQQLNPCFSALSSLRFANGYNILNTIPNAHLMDQFSPNKPKTVFLFSQLIFNINFTISLILIPLLIALVTFILSRTALKNNQTVLKVCKKSIGEYTLMALLFVGYLVSVSCTLEIIFGDKSISQLTNLLSIIECSFLLLCFCFYFTLLLLKPNIFGQFTQNFIKTKICSKFYNFLILERIFIGTLLIILLTINLSIIIPITLYTITAIFIFIFNPYSAKFNNIRQIINQFITVSILTIYLIYNLTNTNTKNQSPIFLYFPLVICLLLSICIIINTIAIIYTFLKKCKQKSFQQLQKQQLAFIQNTRKLSNLSTIDTILSSLTPKQSNNITTTTSIRNRLKLKQVKSQIKINHLLKQNNLTNQFISIQNYNLINVSQNDAI